MGWKLGMILIQEDYSGKFESLLKKLGREDWTFLEHISIRGASRFDFEEMAIGVYNECTFVIQHLWLYDLSFEADERYSLDKKLSALSQEVDVLAFLMDGTSGTYGFSYFRNGARIRLRMVEPGNVLANTGDEFAIESDFPPENTQDESRIFKLAEMVIGIPPEVWLMDESFELEVYTSP